MYIIRDLLKCHLVYIIRDLLKCHLVCIIRDLLKYHLVYINRDLLKHHLVCIIRDEQSMTVVLLEPLHTWTVCKGKYNKPESEELDRGSDQFVQTEGLHQRHLKRQKNHNTICWGANGQNECYLRSFVCLNNSDKALSTNDEVTIMHY